MFYLTPNQPVHCSHASHRNARYFPCWLSRGWPARFSKHSVQSLCKRVCFVWRCQIRSFFHQHLVLACHEFVLAQSMVRLLPLLLSTEKYVDTPRRSVIGCWGKCHLTLRTERFINRAVSLAVKSSENNFTSCRNLDSAIREICSTGFSLISLGII
jgi:hypothetical protein